MPLEDSRFRKAVKSDEHLAVFLRTMRKFDADFCDLMLGKEDFTLKMEVRGAEGKVIHCRVQKDAFDRPKDAPKKEDYR